MSFMDQIDKQLQKLGEKVEAEKLTETCRVCGTELNEENWYPSRQKTNRRICKKCALKQGQLWYKANPDKARAIKERANRKQGKRPFDENKTCSLFLGVHVAERVLSHVFKDVKRMPMHNPGYDVICNHDKLIDIKSACLRKDGQWIFNIKRNTTADYFLCLAFDNREALNPLHVWMIPGSKINHLKNASICQSTIRKWDEYSIDISKISDCCDVIRGD